METFVINQHAIQTSLTTLREKIGELITFFSQDLDFDQMVYPHWSAKDTLGHLTFWHESFARNLFALAHGEKPRLLKGSLKEINQLSVASTALDPIEALLNRMELAQHTIEHYILHQGISQIPYRKNSRDYSAKEHLDIVAAHIARHLKEIRRFYQTHA